jgi:hypothetical protein
MHPSDRTDLMGLMVLMDLMELMILTDLMARQICGSPGRLAPHPWTDKAPSPTLCP